VLGFDFEGSRLTRLGIDMDDTFVVMLDSGHRLVEESNATMYFNQFCVVFPHNHTIACNNQLKSLEGQK